MPGRPCRLELSVTHDETTAVITVVGDLDLKSAYDVYVMAVEQAKSGHRTVVVDVAGVHFVDSTGLGILLRARDELTYDLESKVVLRSPAPQLARLLELTGLSRHFVQEGP